MQADATERPPLKQKHHLDDELRRSAYRLMTERGVQAELVAACFKISTETARSLKRLPVAIRRARA